VAGAVVWVFVGVGVQEEVGCKVMGGGLLGVGAEGGNWAGIYSERPLLLHW